MDLKTDISETSSKPSRPSKHRVVRDIADLLSRTNLPRIAARTNGRVIFLEMSEVGVVEAQGNYVLLRTCSQCYLLRESVSVVERELKPYGFVRIHRSTIVNAALVDQFWTSSSGEMLLRIQGGKEYSVSRRYRSGLRALAACWI
jgi:DNA-binding LytR/AlgR family response regulator